MFKPIFCSFARVWHRELSQFPVNASLVYAKTSLCQVSVEGLGPGCSKAADPDVSAIWQNDLWLVLPFENYTLSLHKI